MVERLECREGRQARLGEKCMLTLAGWGNKRRPFRPHAALWSSARVHSLLARCTADWSGLPGREQHHTAMLATAAVSLRGQAMVFKTGKQQQATGRTAALTVRASRVAEPAALPVVKMDGSDAGQAQIALRVADADTAKG